MFNMKSLKKQAGLSLIEAMLGLAILAVVLVTAVSFYGNAKESSNVTNTISNLGSISSGLRNTFQGNYTGVTNTTVIKSNFMPPNMEVDGSNTLIRNAWSTNGVTIAPATASFSNDSFTITFTGVSEGSCAELGAQTIGQYERVRINNNVISSKADAFTRCNGDNNTLEWRAQ